MPTAGRSDRVPSDILVEGNDFTKRLEWKGAGVAVKNLFELKSARRITIRGNVFERNWTDGQTGYGILFKAVNQDGTAPWSAARRRTVREQCRSRHRERLQHPRPRYAQPHGQVTRVTIKNNLIFTPGVAFQVGGEIGDLRSITTPSIRATR